MDLKDFKVCKKCILPNTFKNIEFDSEGICSYCRNNETVSRQVAITPEERQEHINEIDKIIAENKGKNSYDCVVGFSGGKDSAYLLWKLKTQYGLNILAVTVDHGFFPDITDDNVKIVPKKLSVDQIIYKINSDFMNKFFKYKFDNYKTKAIFDDVCADCSNILEGSVIKIAALFKIPLVFIGLSPEQTNRYFYEISSEHINSQWKAEYFEDNSFTLNDRKYLWNGEANEQKDMKVILPFHVWDYDENVITETLRDEDLLTMEKSNPLKTRCKILDTMAYVDKHRLGYDGFVVPFSDLIRKGRAPRSKYYDLFYGEGYQYNEEHINEVIKTLGLDIEGIINK